MEVIQNHNSMIRFLKYRWFFVALSLFIIIGGLVSVVVKGYVFSIDFVGGGLVEFSTTKPLQISNIRIWIDKNHRGYLLQQTDKGFVIKSKDLSVQRATKLSSELTKIFQLKKERFEIVGPSVGAENIKTILIASVIAVIGILLYLSFNFKSWNFAIAAVVALFHDMLILLVCWSILGLLFGTEFDILFITSLLTTMSFSVHDTIIILDKIQEERKHNKGRSLEETIDLALNLTMVRSLNNSLTVVIMLTTLIVLGGESVRWFACALLIGTLTGAYSSPFIATPTYYLLERKRG